MAVELTRDEAARLSYALREVTVIPDKFIPLALWACSQQLYYVYSHDGAVDTASATLALMVRLHECAKAARAKSGG